MVTTSSAPASRAVKARRASPPLSLAIAWIAAVLQMLWAVPPRFADVAVFAVLYATAAYGTRLVFFDNTYMYPRTATPQTEQTPFEPVGRKATVRAQIADAVSICISKGAGVDLINHCLTPPVGGCRRV